MVLNHLWYEKMPGVSCDLILCVDLRLLLFLLFLRGQKSFRIIYKFYGFVSIVNIVEIDHPEMAAQVSIFRQIVTGQVVPRL